MNLICREEGGGGGEGEGGGDGREEETWFPVFQEFHQFSCLSAQFSPISDQFETISYPVPSPILSILFRIFCVGRVKKSDLRVWRGKISKYREIEKTQVCVTEIPKFN